MSRILVDYTHIPLEKVGVGNYAFNLVLQLLKIDRLNSYFIVIMDDDDSLNDMYYSNFTLIKVNHKLFRNMVARLILEQIYLPLLICTKRINIIHSLHYSFPILSFRVMKVVTIHDMTFYLFPKFHIPLKRVYFQLFIKLASLLSHRIICVSEATKKDFCSFFPNAEKKTIIIPLGKDERFSFNLDRKNCARVLEKYCLSDKYILFIGTIEPRKNLKRLISAYRKLLDINLNYKLVIVGKKGWYYDSIFNLVNEQKLQDKVLFTGYVEENDKPLLISCAEIFVYPSLYEGFGIPVLEALSCGVPTITSKISSMPEVAGNAALLVNPEDDDAIFNAMYSLLTDRQLYNKLREKSIIQSKKFTWEITAEKTLDVYNTIK